MWAIHAFEKSEYKQIRLFSNLLILVHGWGWSEPLQVAQGVRQNQPWTGHLSIAGHTHTHIQNHSALDNVDTPIPLTCTALRCERKLEDLEKIHADMGRTCRKWLQPKLIIFSHQCYNEMRLKEKTLCQDLLYISYCIILIMILYL